MLIIIDDIFNSKFFKNLKLKIKFFNENSCKHWRIFIEKLLFGIIAIVQFGFFFFKYL